MSYDQAEFDALVEKEWTNALTGTKNEGAITLAYYLVHAGNRPIAQVVSALTSVSIPEYKAFAEKIKKLNKPSMTEVLATVKRLFEDAEGGSLEECVYDSVREIIHQKNFTLDELLLLLNRLRYTHEEVGVVDMAEAYEKIIRSIKG